MNNKIKVLLVDDHPLVLDGISARLEGEQSLEVVGMANDGKQALEKAQELNPDVVLMDISMPQMDGFEATHAIRDLEMKHPSAHCPIVALTANVLKEDKDRCLQAGMDDFLTKPVRKTALMDAIQKWTAPVATAGAT